MNGEARQDSARGLHKGPELTGDTMQDIQRASEGMLDRAEEEVGGEPTAWWVVMTGESGLMIASPTGEDADTILLHGLLASMGLPVIMAVMGRVLPHLPDAALDALEGAIAKARQGGEFDNP